MFECSKGTATEHMQTLGKDEAQTCIFLSLVLCKPRVGICPLHSREQAAPVTFSHQPITFLTGSWLLFVRTFRRHRPSHFPFALRYPVQFSWPTGAHFFALSRMFRSLSGGNSQVCPDVQCGKERTQLSPTIGPLGRGWLGPAVRMCRPGEPPGMSSCDWEV